MFASLPRDLPEEGLPLPSFQQVFGLILSNTNQSKYLPFPPLTPSKKRSSKYVGAMDGRVMKKNRDDGGDESIGRWTAEEHSKFLEGVMKYGKDWKKMQPLIKTRSLVQIRTHAQKVFKKIGLKKFTPQHFEQLTVASSGIALALDKQLSDEPDAAQTQSGQVIGQNSGETGASNGDRTHGLVAGDALGMHSVKSPSTSGGAGAESSSSSSSAHPGHGDQMSQASQQSMLSASMGYSGYSSFLPVPNSSAPSLHDGILDDDGAGDDDFEEDDNTDDDPLLELANSYAQLIQHHSPMLSMNALASSGAPPSQQPQPDSPQQGDNAQNDYHDFDHDTITQLFLQSFGGDSNAPDGHSYDSSSMFGHQGSSNHDLSEAIEYLLPQNTMHGSPDASGGNEEQQQQQQVRSKR